MYGTQKELSELSANLSVNIIQNSSKTYTEIVASKNTITGKVSGIDEDYVVIEGEKFKIDSYYKELSKDSSTGATEISLGSLGKFYYTNDNVIVGFIPEGTASFGLVRKVWIDEETGSTYVKMFTQTGEWINFEMTENPQVDGVRVKEDLISNKIKNALGENNENSPTPVRYILQEDKIRFIDTLYNAPEEENDPERMQKCATFSGRTQWVKGWDMGGSMYHVGNDTPMFVVPKDVEKEDEYKISAGSAIPADTEGATYTAYNPDKYHCARLAVLGGAVSTSSKPEPFIYIKGVS